MGCIAENSGSLPEAKDPREDCMVATKPWTAIAKFFLCGAIALIFVSLCAGPSAAQTMTTGQVVGQVTDPSGGAVPGAKVDLRDLATAAVRSTTTNGQGQYLFPQVSPGNYSVTV